MAALNESLQEALLHHHDLQDQQRLKRVFAEVMAEITVRIINPAVEAFPELEPNEETWVSVVRAKAADRSVATSIPKP